MATLLQGPSIGDLDAWWWPGASAAGNNLTVCSIALRLVETTKPALTTGGIEALL